MTAERVDSRPNRGIRVLRATGTTLEIAGMGAFVVCGFGSYLPGALAGATGAVVGEGAHKLADRLESRAAGVPKPPQIPETSH